MIGVRIEFRNAAELQQQLRDKFKTKLKEYEIWLEAVMDQYYQQIISEFPKKSGKTASGIRLQKKKGIYTLTADSMVVFYLEYGTRDHGSVTAKALHFNIDGQEIFAKWVRGIEPNPIIGRATDALISTLEAAFRS